MIEPERLAFSVAEAAALAGICRDRIYLAIRRRQLPARKAGRRTLIRRTDLEEWIENLPALKLNASEASADAQAMYPYNRSGDPRCKHPRQGQVQPGVCMPVSTDSPKTEKDRS